MLRSAASVGFPLLWLGARFFFQTTIVERLGILWLFVTVKTYGGLTWQMLKKDFSYLVGETKFGFNEVAVQYHPDDDNVSKLCKLNLYTKFAEELFSGVIVNDLLEPGVFPPKEERIEAFLQACREVYHRLPRNGEHRRALDSIEPLPDPLQFLINVTHPFMNGHWRHSDWGTTGAAFAKFGILPALASYPEEFTGYWEQLRNAAFRTDEAIRHRLKPEEEMSDLPLEQLRALGLRPVQDERINATMIPGAFRKGLTAVFDARELCGEKIFNLTVPDIALLHRDIADKIPAFRLQSSGNGYYDSLSELARRFARWREIGWMVYPDYGPFPADEAVTTRNGQMRPRHGLAGRLEATAPALFGADGTNPDVLSMWLGYLCNLLNQYKQKMTQTTINVKRLPNLPLKDMHKAMGSPDWIEGVWSLLWIGPVGDFWHFDEEDNVLINLSGKIYVAVLEQWCTHYISGTRNVGLGWNDLQPFFERDGKWVENHAWIRNVPLHFLNLKPGQGVTVPSKTYHNVMAFDGNRVLMNGFALSKYRAMEEAPSAPDGWYAPGSQAETFRAMRLLKQLSLVHLWESRQLGGFFAGLKLEFM